MKSKHDIQLELLQEIDEICSENDLKYIFVGNNAFNAYVNHTIRNNFAHVSVAMTLGDINRFCDIVEKQNDPNRYVEGMFNNPKYVRLYVSYGNENTTDYHMISLDNNLHHGINVRIYPIIKSFDLDGNKIEVMDSRISKEYKLRKFLNKKVVNKKYTPIRLGISLADTVYDVSGFRKKYPEKIFDNIFIDKWEDIQKYSKVQIGKNIINTRYFKEITKCQVDNLELNYPKDTKNYFKQIYGRDIEDVNVVLKSERINAIVDTEISYKTILSETKDLLDEIRSTHEELVWGRFKVRKEKECVDRVWNLVQMTSAQIYYIDFFEEKIDYLLSLDLNDEAQFEEMEIVLNPVIRRLEMYANRGMTFSIDEKTDSLIRKFLLLNGNENLIDRMDEIKKHEYFVE
ncbi:hypothetical protein [Methanobrevibacter sp.]|uniref:hypothetical protein n=1 Tax=Methanobrevibacter sp. TaxID=66852 RepID=UPI00386509EB